MGFRCTFVVCSEARFVCDGEKRLVVFSLQTCSNCGQEEETKKMYQVATATAIISSAHIADCSVCLLYLNVDQQFSWVINYGTYRYDKMRYTLDRNVTLVVNNVLSGGWYHIIGTHRCDTPTGSYRPHQRYRCLLYTSDAADE